MQDSKFYNASNTKIWESCNNTTLMVFKTKEDQLLIICNASFIIYLFYLNYPISDNGMKAITQECLYFIRASKGNQWDIKS